jgi:hypothetical protein
MLNRSIQKFYGAISLKKIISALLLVVFPVYAFPADILIYKYGQLYEERDPSQLGSTPSAELAARQIILGNTPTTIDVGLDYSTYTPLNLSNYAQVWDLGATYALGANQITAYSNYLKSGGSLFLMGENGAYGPNRNATISSFISGIVSNSVSTDPTARNILSNVASFIQHPSAPYNNPGTQVLLPYEGKFSSLGGGICIISSCGAVLWNLSSLTGGLYTGHIISVLDVNFMQLHSPFWANQTTLSTSGGYYTQAFLDNLILYFNEGSPPPPPNGPDSGDTQASMQYQARQLRSAFNSQTVSANFGLNLDCNVFDVKGMCISAGGRYTTIDNPGINNSAAVVTLGYKVNPNIRIGAYLDQNINISKPTGINISNNTPLMGLYAVWNKEQSGLGYQVRLANTYQEKDVTQTRSVFNTSEAGSGKSNLKSQSYLAELSYAFQYEDKTLVRPYAGLRYTHLKQDGYTEATTDAVTDPLTIASIKDRSASALLGVKVNRTLTDKATLTGQLGLEQDLYHKVDNYQATSLNNDALSPIAFNGNVKRTRPVASAGAFYDVTKTQRASATINYQQTPFQSTSSVTGYFNYTIGF